MQPLSGEKGAVRPWLVVADDLTGAADCGIAFAKAGFETVVTWGKDADAGGAPVLSLDTDSRSLPAAAAAEKQVAALAVHYRPGGLVYKKIDSTMRGQPAAELAAELAFLGRDGAAFLAVVAPAFPGTGRTTEGGRILVNGAPLEETPMWAREHTYASAYLPDVLGGVGLKAETVPLAVVRQGAETVRAALVEARARKVAAVVCDAASEADLAAIAAASLDLDRVVWVGSGGLAVHLARAVAPLGAKAGSLTAGNGRPVLVAVGSLAESSRRQADYLASSGLVQRVLVSAEDLFAGPDGDGWNKVGASLTRLLGQGQDVLVEIADAVNPNLARGPELAALFARAIAPAVPLAGALVLTGGDTACALLSHLGVRGIRLVEEVEAGVPLGVTIGAIGLPVVSKAGAFGDEQTLARCIKRLQLAASANR